MALFVKFWGTRGSIPTPGFKTQRYGGNTSCVEVRNEQTSIICDGGSGIRELGLDLMRRAGKQPMNIHLLLSHTHWDHIQGFPFFLPTYLPTTTVYVYGASKQDRSSYQLLTGQMESAHFPVTFSQLGAKFVARELDNVGGVVIGEIAVRSYPQCHPGGSLGFTFQNAGRKVVYGTDNEIDKLLLNAEAVNDDASVPRQFPPELLEAVQGADVFIADAQYSDAEYRGKIGWGHARASTVVDLAVQAGVKQVALFHHDPMHSDADVESKISDCVSRAKRACGANSTPPLVFGAREGMELKIP